MNCKNRTSECEAGFTCPCLLYEESSESQHEPSKLLEGSDRKCSEEEIKINTLNELENKLRIWDNKVNAIPNYVWKCIKEIKEEAIDNITKNEETITISSEDWKKIREEIRLKTMDEVFRQWNLATDTSSQGDFNYWLYKQIKCKIRN